MPYHKCYLGCFGTSYSAYLEHFIRWMDLTVCLWYFCIQKEEQNASSSANYDVELFHAAEAHADLLSSGEQSPIFCSHTFCFSCTHLVALNLELSHFSPENCSVFSCNAINGFVLLIMLWVVSVISASFQKSVVCVERICDTRVWF